MEDLYYQFTLHGLPLLLGQVCQVNTLGYVQAPSGAYWKKSGIMNQAGSASATEVTFDFAKSFCLNENAGMLIFHTPEDYQFYLNNTGSNITYFLLT